MAKANWKFHGISHEKYLWRVMIDCQNALKCPKQIQQHQSRKHTLKGLPAKSHTVRHLCHRTLETKKQLKADKNDILQRLHQTCCTLSIALSCSKCTECLHRFRFWPSFKFLAGKLIFLSLGQNYLRKESVLAQNGIDVGSKAVLGSFIGRSYPCPT